MTRGAFPLVLQLSAEEGFAVTAIMQVHGKDNGGRARSFGSLNDRPADFPDIRRIELLPDWRACCSGCVFNGRGGDRGQHHEMALCMSCPGHGHFAFGMECFLSTHWGEHNRSTPLRAKE